MKHNKINEEIIKGNSLGLSSCVQIVEAMEIMLLAVVSPEIRCEWRLEDWQVALVSTVSNTAQVC